MYIILSQRIDILSEYEDNLYRLYHFPVRYKNQIHEGDIFIYYQGNRYVKEHRYYHGTGTISHVWTNDNENYYASIINPKKFSLNVPIYHDESYFECIGHQEVRKSKNPPWQSSIRPVSQEAYNLILSRAGELIPMGEPETEVLERLEQQLKVAIKNYYLNNRVDSILEIREISEKIASIRGLRNGPSAEVHQELTELDKHCNEMSMSNSYNAILILGMLDLGKGTKPVANEDLANYFIQYNKNRKFGGRQLENDGIFTKETPSLALVIKNIETNSLKELSGAGILELSEGYINFTPHINTNNSNWIEKARVACQERLEIYFKKMERTTDRNG